MYNPSLKEVVRASGLRFSWCGCCNLPCLADKRSLCCGDAAYDDEPLLLVWLAEQVPDA